MNGEEDNDENGIVPIIYGISSTGTNMCTILRGKRTTSRLKERRIQDMRQSQVRLGQRIPKRKGNNRRGKSALSR